MSDDLGTRFNDKTFNSQEEAMSWIRENVSPEDRKSLTVAIITAVGAAMTLWGIYWFASKENKSE